MAHQNVELQLEDMASHERVSAPSVVDLNYQICCIASGNSVGGACMLG
jgi:hypothetical protein